MGTALIPQQPRSESVARYSVFTIQRLNGQGEIPIAVLLLDTENDTLHVRFCEDLGVVADSQALDVLEALADDIAAKARSEGGAKLFEGFLDSLSNYVRMEEPRTLSVPRDRDWRTVLDQLFSEFVRRQPDSPA